MQGIPALNLPDVCTSSPERGKAFCTEHCLLLQRDAPDVPLELREFLKFCGAQPSGKIRCKHLYSHVAIFCYNPRQNGLLRDSLFIPRLITVTMFHKHRNHTVIYRLMQQC